MVRRRNRRRARACRHGLRPARLLQNAFAYGSLTYARIKRRIIRELCPVRTSLLLFFPPPAPVQTLCEEPLKALRRPFVHASFLSLLPLLLLHPPFRTFFPFIFMLLAASPAGNARHMQMRTRACPTDARYLIDSLQYLLFKVLG